MFLRSNRRFKDGKEHRYWSIVENKRCAGGKVVQRAVMYLGEINDSQREAWCRVIEAFDEEAQQPTQLALFPADRSVPEHARGHGVQIRLGAMELHAPRQWGRVGWPAIYTSNSVWTTSGPNTWHARVKAQAGAISCRR
jgi:hypothetical protein